MACFGVVGAGVLGRDRMIVTQGFSTGMVRLLWGSNSIVLVVLVGVSMGSLAGSFVVAARNSDVAAVLHLLGLQSRPSVGAAGRDL